MSMSGKRHDWWNFDGRETSTVKAGVYSQNFCQGGGNARRQTTVSVNRCTKRARKVWTKMPPRSLLLALPRLNKLLRRHKSRGNTIDIIKRFKNANILLIERFLPFSFPPHLLPSPFYFSSEWKTVLINLHFQSFRELFFCQYFGLHVESVLWFIKGQKKKQQGLNCTLQSKPSWEF